MTLQTGKVMCSVLYYDIIHKLSIHTYSLPLVYGKLYYSWVMPSRKFHTL